MSLELVISLGSLEGRAQLTLIIEQQVLGVVHFLEQLRARVVASRDLLLLAIESPPDLIAASEVVNLLEALAVVHVGELFTFLVLSEVDDELGDGFGTLLLVGKFALQVRFLVAVNLLLEICHI